MPTLVSRRSKIDLRKIVASIDSWNCNNAVGTPVNYRTDAGTIVKTKTRSPAEVLGNHTPVIWLAGVGGCVALDRVTARDD